MTLSPYQHLYQLSFQHPHSIQLLYRHRRRYFVVSDLFYCQVGNLLRLLPCPEPFVSQRFSQPSKSEVRSQKKSERFEDSSCSLFCSLCLLSSAFCPLSSVSCILSSVFCLLYSVFCLLYSVFCLLPFPTLRPSTVVPSSFPNRFEIDSMRYGKAKQRKL